MTENGGGTTGLQKLGSALANYASTDNAAFAASVVANLGITGTSATTATTNVKALLDSYGADRGKALMQPGRHHGQPAVRRYLGCCCQHLR